MKELIEFINYIDAAEELLNDSEGKWHPSPAQWTAIKKRIDKLRILTNEVPLLQLSDDNLAALAEQVLDKIQEKQPPPAQPIIEHSNGSYQNSTFDSILTGSLHSRQHPNQPLVLDDISFPRADPTEFA